MSFRASMLVVLSIVVSTTSAYAAEDDVVIGVTVQQPATPLPTPPAPAAGSIVRIMRDGKPVWLYTPNDRSGELPNFVTQLDEFLKSTGNVCSLTDEQVQKLKLAGRRDIQRFTQKQEQIELIREVVNGKTIMRVPNKLNSNVARAVSGTDFITEESLVYKVLMTQLTPEQKQKFEAFQEKEWNPINRNFTE